MDLTYKITLVIIRIAESYQQSEEVLNTSETCSNLLSLLCKGQAVLKQNYTDPDRCGSMPKHSNIPRDATSTYLKY